MTDLEKIILIYWVAGAPILTCILIYIDNSIKGKREKKIE